MRALLVKGLALLGLGAPALAAAGSGTCDTSSCQAGAPVGVSLIQTKPSTHHKVSGPAGKQDHTDLAEAGDEREGTEHHKVSAHAGKHQQTGLGKDESKRKDSQHHKGSGHAVMNSTQSAHAGKHNRTGLGEEETRREDSLHQRMSGHVVMKATQAAADDCTVELFRDGVTDCNGVAEKTFTTASAKGEEFMLPDNDWASAKLTGNCASVEFYDDDWASSKQNAQVPGNAGCVRFEYDLLNDMNGIKEIAVPVCKVTLFREGVVDCKGTAGQTYSSSKTDGEEFTPPDNDWASALVGPECTSVTFRDDDWASSEQDVTVDGKAGCVRFEYDLLNDMKGVMSIVAKPIPR